VTRFRLHAVLQGLSSTPELAKEYPLILSTGRHETSLSHTESRWNPHLLSLAPKPYLYIHPKTAARYGIGDGEYVKVESTAGTAYAYAHFTLGIREDTVQGVPGWKGDENMNLLVPWGRYAQGIGTVCARGFLCRVGPAAPMEEVR
jgi:anaerobic selenocysteine-containing dehydrogenase